MEFIILAVIIYFIIKALSSNDSSSSSNNYSSTSPNSDSSVSYNDDSSDMQNDSDYIDETVAKRTTDKYPYQHPHQWYIDALEQYYTENGDKAFDLSSIDSFMGKYNLRSHGIKDYEVFSDLLTIELNRTDKLPCSPDILSSLRLFSQQYGATIKYNGVPCEILVRKRLEQSQETQSTSNINNIKTDDVVEDLRTNRTDKPVQKHRTQNQNVSNTSTVNTPIRQTLSKQRFNFQGYETSYPNLSDISGKVLEVILLSGSDDNGFFNYYANVAKNILPSWGRNIVPQNDRQKSIVVKDNEYWICQYFYNPYDTSVDGIVEYTLHLDSNGKISVAWDDTDDMIPDTDIYRTGMTPLWTVLGDFISLPTTYDQRKEIATWVEKSSQGTFIYEEQYHDIRSYSLGRSATLEETAMLLSIEDVWAKVEFVKK